LAAEKGKEKDTRSVDISGRAAELNLPDDLWCHVRRCSTEHLDFLLIRYTGRKPKINQFDLLSLIQHYVFQLNISMSNALAMEVVQSIHELLVNLTGIILCHPSVRFRLQEAMSGSSWHILKHQDDLILSLNSFIQSGDMRMV
jgi:hypothetical protein